MARQPHMEHSSIVASPALVRLVGAVGLGVLALRTGLACSVAPSISASIPPPSEAAAPWVGCYTCETSLTGIPTLPWLDGGVIAASFTNGLSVSASGDTLSAWVADLDSGGYVCWLRATVTSNDTASLAPPDAEPLGCDIETNGELVFDQYTEGEFTLDDGGLSGKLSVWFPLPYCFDGGPPCNDAGVADGGIGSQVSSCTRLPVRTCPWK
jgi:hypothetical protein